MPWVPYEKFQLLNKSSYTTINLPVDARQDVVEEVLVEKLGDNQYRIASSPGIIEGLAADDVIALDAQGASGFQILQRG